MIVDRQCLAAAGVLALAIAALGAAPASAADLPVVGRAFRGVPDTFAAPSFASPARFDANGYAYKGPTLAYPPSPFYASTGCPVAFQPVYDASGNFAGYGGLRLCGQ